MAPNVSGQSTVTTLQIRYSQDGEQKKRTLFFKGNFGFSINGRQYDVKDGHVTKDGKEVQALDFKDNYAIARQLIGMSNTASSAIDYTYSPKEIAQVKEDQNSGFANTSKNRLRNSMGEGVPGKVESATYDSDKGAYTTSYQVKKGQVSTISVWMQNN